MRTEQLIISLALRCLMAGVHTSSSRVEAEYALPIPWPESLLERVPALVLLLFLRRSLQRSDGGHRFWQTKKLDEFCELNICVIESELRRWNQCYPLTHDPRYVACDEQKNIEVLRDGNPVLNPHRNYPHSPGPRMKSPPTCLMFPCLPMCFGCVTARCSHCGTSIKPTSLLHLPTCLPLHSRT